MCLLSKIKVHTKGILFANFVEVTNLSKSFSDLTVLNDLSFSVEKGSVVGVIGPSGAGKSTLMRCLSLVTPPDTGRISINGTDITSLSQYELEQFRYSIGQVFQQFHLFSSRTVFENVRFPLEIQGIKNDDQVVDLLHLVNLYDKKDAYPSQLSGGQKQRVSIARALVRSPSILLCDEATSALDSQSKYEVLSLLQKLQITTIFISHDIEAVDHVCSHILVLDNGTIVEEGPKSKLFLQPKHPTTKKLLRY